ncbi:hypothetical protein MMC07_005616 [Pseudocyphellaria aurata]|nr:hypothetical protein [Pseudocyphellaria aurata]
MTYQYHNYPGQAPTPLPDDFTLNAAPGSDIWKKPPSRDAFDGPICYRTIPLSTFRRARVTVSAEWRTLYDQGGLCLVLPQSQAWTTSAWEKKWVKTGIEVYNGSPHVSTVACDRWADWSLWPLESGTVTIEMEREVKAGKPTSTLWVYIVDGEKRRPVREVTWVFEGVDDGKGSDCWVGVYAAKPTKDDDDEKRELQVLFSGVKIETC